jgi:hypothetical protein
MSLGFEPGKVVRSRCGEVAIVMETLEVADLDENEEIVLTLKSILNGYGEVFVANSQFWDIIDGDDVQ